MSVRDFVERFASDAWLVGLAMLAAALALAIVGVWAGLALLGGIYAALVLAVVS